MENYISIDYYNFVNKNKTIYIRINYKKNNNIQKILL
jgi:hypothetical protein